MQAIVLQQFNQKFARHNSRAINQAQKICIKKLCASFFSSLDSSLASASELYKLEETVRKECEKVPDQVSEYKRTFQSGANPPQKTVPKLSLNEGPKQVKSLPKNIGDDWTALTIANAIEFEEKKKNDKEKDKQMKRRQRENFDSQMNEVKARKMAELEEGKKEREENKKRYDTYLQQEADRQAREKVQHDKLRDMYSDQLRDKRERIAREKSRVNEEAKKEAASLQRQIERTR